MIFFLLTKENVEPVTKFSNILFVNLLSFSRHECIYSSIYLFIGCCDLYHRAILDSRCYCVYIAILHIFVHLSLALTIQLIIRIYEKQLITNFHITNIFLTQLNFVNQFFTCHLLLFLFAKTVRELLPHVLSNFVNIT